MRNFALAAVLISLASVPVDAAAPTTGELLRYVPAVAEVVVAMDAAALRDHPMVQTWLIEHQSAWSGSGSDAQEFLREAGLDPLRDVDSMVVAMVPAAGGERGLAAFGGRFDPVSLGAALAKRGSQPVTIGSFTALRLQDRQHSDSSAPLVYLSQDVVLAGDEATLRASLAGPAPANALVGREIAAGRLDLRAPFWLVAAMPERARARMSAARSDDGSGDGAMEAFRSVVAASHTVLRVTIQASLSDELTMSGWVAADTEENAGLLRDAIKGAIAAARLHAQDQSPELVDVLRNIRVSVDGSEVRGSASVPVALLEKLVAEHEKPCRPHASQAN